VLSVNLQIENHATFALSGEVMHISITVRAIFRAKVNKLTGGGIRQGGIFFLTSFCLYEMARAPFTSSAEAHLTGWPNARPQGWDKCSVGRGA